MTDAIRAALRTRYSLPSWVLLEELPNGTGATKTRTADAVAFDCYPSRGLEVHGLEIKLDRRDWLRELKQPDKSEAFTFCDRWWVVAPAGVLKVEELPKGWGWLRPQKNGLRAVVPAPKRIDVPMPPEFIACALRRAAMPNAEAVENARRAGKREGRRERPKTEVATSSWERAHGHLKKAVDDFEAASGVKISAYQGDYLGRAFAALLEMRRNAGSALARNLPQRLREAADSMEVLRKELDAARACGPRRKT